MRPLRYSINVTLDGNCSHDAIDGDAEVHRRSAETLAQADALIFGRTTYEMMEGAWRPPAEPGSRSAETELFVQTINAAKKYVVSSTLESVDWNAEIVRGDFGQFIRELKQQPGEGLFVGGVTLPLALAEMDLIDEYEFVVHPRVVGHGLRLFEGLPKSLELRLIDKVQYDSGAMALRYEPKR